MSKNKISLKSNYLISIAIIKKKISNKKDIAIYDNILLQRLVISSLEIFPLSTILN